MRKVRAEDECCAYRESLARKKEARSRKKPRNVTAGCCGGKRLTCAEISKVTEEPSTPVTCGKIVKKKLKRMKKQESCSIDPKILARIKPSISEREKYFNIHHLACILEVEELIRLREIQKACKKSEESDDLAGSEIQIDKPTNQPTETDQKVEQIASSIKSVKSERSGDGNEEKNSLTVGGKTSEQIAENKNRDKKVKMAAGKCALENKVECGSICSFDSEIDLSGLHLTKEDVEKIEENREQIRQQQKAKQNETMYIDAEE